MRTPLADLDELLLRCRDENAQSLMSEAVASYRSSALRSAVVATWIAVCFDLIEKLRELALAGDTAAEKQVERLERIRRTGDLSAALAFERDLLKLARDDFELISPLEFVDLERLQFDRNRCAHPSLLDESTHYVPSAELVRAHIYAAINHVLRHPPAQGKYALDRLLAQVESDYFPTKEADALTALSVGPLSRPRDSLVRNFVVVLIKRALSKDRARMRYFAALAAVRKMHSALYDQILTSNLSGLLRSLDDESIHGALRTIHSIPGAWDALDPDVAQKFKNYVESLPSAKIDELEWILDYEPVHLEACRRAARASRKELRNAVFFMLPKELGDRLIQLYHMSSSFDEANDLAKELIGYKDDFSADQVRYLFQRAASNKEIIGSFRFHDLVEAFRKENIIGADHFDALLKSAGLEDFVSEPDDDIPF